jgi:hypothetical protein
MSVPCIYLFFNNGAQHNNLKFNLLRKEEEEEEK